VCWIKKYSLERIKTLHEAIKAQKGRYRGSVTIYRDSKPIELTSKERIEAYQEQQAIYDCQNIKDNLGWILETINTERSEWELIENQDFVDKAAKYSRDLQDSGDMNYTAAIAEGVRKAIREMEENGEL